VALQPAALNVCELEEDCQPNANSENELSCCFDIPAWNGEHEQETAGCTFSDCADRPRFYGLHLLKLAAQLCKMNFEFHKDISVHPMTSEGQLTAVESSLSRGEAVCAPSPNGLYKRQVQLHKHKRPRRRVWRNCNFKLERGVMLPKSSAHCNMQS
jgi:hypothetical protein